MSWSRNAVLICTVQVTWISCLKMMYKSVTSPFDDPSLCLSLLHSTPTRSADMTALVAFFDLIHTRGSASWLLCTLAWYVTEFLPIFLWMSVTLPTNLAFFFGLIPHTQPYSSVLVWRKNTNKMQQYRWIIVNFKCWLLTTVSTCFGHLYAHYQEKRPRVTAYGLYLLVVLDVAGCGTVVLRWGCEHCEGCCSMMMGIKMPETCRDCSQ